LTLLLKNKIFIYIVPLILGVISSFSLPPYGFFFINFITFPLLLIYLISNKNENKWFSFVIGWMFGFGYFLSSLYWITNALTFDEIFKVLIPFALILIPLFLALFYGLSTLVFSFFNCKKKISSILIFSTFFSCLEFIRGYILGGFPWNLISYTWTEYPEFLQVLSLIGTYSFNLLNVTFFLIPAIIFFKYKFKTKLFIIIFTIIFLTSNFIYGSFKIKKNQKIDEIKIDFLVKIISPKIHIKRYFENKNPEEIILDLIKLSDPDKSKKTIFIFPEGALSNIYLQDLENYRYIFSENFSNKHKIILGINSVENNNVYNSMVVLDKDINVLAKYRKNKLVPFGEFLPFESILSNLGLKKITQGYRSFSSDNKRKIISVFNLDILPLICYEIIYSGEIVKYDENYDLIINISEDGWFGDSIGPYQHFSHSVFRSIEEGKNLIRSTNNGISAYINSRGEIMNKIESTEEGVISVKSFKKTEKTLFSSFGNKIFFYFLIIYTSLIFFLKKKETK